VFGLVVALQEVRRPEPRSRRFRPCPIQQQSIRQARAERPAGHLTGWMVVALAALAIVRRG
jgi:hypothetical protein